MKAAVVVFPGSNCDDDCRHVLADVLGVPTAMVWHKETELPPGIDLVVLPGGFSYGDYLRAGAIAGCSPIMDAVVRHQARGGFVFGICNGFQILTESGLLPGALRHNAHRRFICRDTPIRAGQNDHPLTRAIAPDADLIIPVAHAEGRYVANTETLARLRGEGQVLFRYVEADGQIAATASINGSMDAIAGITNAAGTVFGMMPHPERAAEAIVGGPGRPGGNTDGRALFEGVLQAVGGA